MIGVCIIREGVSVAEFDHWDRVVAIDEGICCVLVHARGAVGRGAGKNSDWEDCSCAAYSDRADVSSTDARQRRLWSVCHNPSDAIPLCPRYLDI
jgi:hypothetical protein